MATTPPLVEDEPQQKEVLGPTLTPIDLSGYNPLGKYASFDVSPEPMFGPDELGEYISAINDLSETCTRADSAARNFEVLQAWDARNNYRGYQFNICGKGGWSFPGVNTSGARSGAEALAYQQANKLWATNVYNQRGRKYQSTVARDLPAFTFSPKRAADPIDQTAADEAKKYYRVWINQADVRNLAKRIARLQYTDGRVVLYTRSVADQQRWGTETPDEQKETFGEPSPSGVTPETELQPEPEQSEQPAVREITDAGGKLEWKLPIYNDEQCEMAWARNSKEVNQNILKERYPWIASKIKAGGAGSKNGGGADQLDRLARINVRLAVQSSTSSGESWQQDATETFTWYRPSQYHAIKDDAVRELFFETFPDGLLVVHAGGELAFIRNESMDRKLDIIHPYEGDGQNRESVGDNYLPLQKRLNANMGLADRTFRGAVARRFADVESLDIEALNGQPSDPTVIIPVKLAANQKISDITGIENVPTVSDALLQYIQWYINEAPEAMDGMSPAMFGMEDADTFGATKLNRDQALQVVSMPWSNMCLGLAGAAQKAVESGAANRLSNIDANIPGEGRIVVELSNLQGNVICTPESMEIPQTLAEEEARFAGLVEASPNVPLYQKIINNPINWPKFAEYPAFSNLVIDGVSDVEQQQGENELLLQGTPQPNPELAQLQQQLQAIDLQFQQGLAHPEAQTPDGQQAMMQLQAAAQQIQQQIQQTPPLVSSVPVAQNGSEDHAIHAAVVLDTMKSAEGRKLKNGTPEQQQIFQNLELHWQAHVEMGAKLTPPKPIEMRASVTVDPTKLPPEAQAKAFQALGLQVAPEELESDKTLVPHEVTTEKEGVNEQGIPVKQKISMVNPGGKLS